MASENMKKHEELKKKPLPSKKIKSNIIHQSDENGAQILAKPAKLSWLASFCNCFRVIDTNYKTHTDILLLGPQREEDLGKSTLVLDLDETLVHSTFKQCVADICMDIEIEQQIIKVFVLKRPGVMEFLRKCCEKFEVIVFTASLQAYAEPLMNILDPKARVASKLYRDSCTYMNGGYAKDLSRLGRDLKNVVIVDNSPFSYSLQPLNAVPIQTWIDDYEDSELDSLWDILDSLASMPDIPKIIGEIKKRNWELSAASVEKLMEKYFIANERAPFNSPVFDNSKVFRFD